MLETFFYCFLFMFIIHFPKKMVNATCIPFYLYFICQKACAHFHFTDFSIKSEYSTRYRYSYHMHNSLPCLISSHISDTIYMWYFIFLFANSIWFLLTLNKWKYSYLCYDFILAMLEDEGIQIYILYLFQHDGTATVTSLSMVSQVYAT
jgi:hypothetical protein